MTLIIRVPTHIGVYKLKPKARFRTALNLVRQRRKIYDQAGIKISNIIFMDGKKGRLVVKLQPALL